MLKYTKAAVHKIVDEVALFAYLAKIILSVFSAAYLFIMCFIDIGSVVMNVVLLALTLTNLFAYVIGRGLSRRRDKAINAGIKRSARIAKLLLNAVNLANVIYMIIVHASSVETIKLVMTPIFIIVWFVQATLELLSMYLSSRCTLFVDGIQMDFEPALRAKDGFNNAVHSFFGEERDEQSYNISERNRAILSARAGEDVLKTKDKKLAKRKLRSRRIKYLLHEKWRKKKRTDATKAEKETEKAIK